MDANLMPLLIEANCIIKAISDEFIGQAIGYFGQLSGLLGNPFDHALKGSPASFQGATIFFSIFTRVGNPGLWSGVLPARDGTLDALKFSGTRKRLVCPRFQHGMELWMP